MMSEPIAQNDKKQSFCQNFIFGYFWNLLTWLL